MNIVVYTALFGDRGRLWSNPPTCIEGVSYIAFTDKPRKEVGLWTHLSKLTILPGSMELKPMRPTWEQRIVTPKYSNRKAARFIKTMAHEVLPEADVSIWVDANIRPLISGASMIEKWLKSNSLAAFKHPDRTCLFDEAGFCLHLGKASRRVLAAQVQQYDMKQMPRHWGLASTRCLIRRHTEEVAELNVVWWKEIRTFSLRDQISLPYVCWKLGLKWNIIPGHALRHPHFWYLKHRGVL
jgi:hypothetical protein